MWKDAEKETKIEDEFYIMNCENSQHLRVFLELKSAEIIFWDTRKLPMEF